MQSNLWPWLILFFVINCISAIISDYRLTSLDNLRQLFVAYILFALTLIFIASKEFIRTLPKILIISISLSAFLAVIGYVFGIPFFAIHVGTESLGRGTGAAGDPNYLAAMIVFGLPLLAHWFFLSRSLLEKIVVFLLFIINSIALLSTYSRSGAIAFTIIFIFVFVEHFKKFRPKYLGFVASLAIVTLIAVVFYVPRSYWERTRSISNITSEAADTAIKRRVSYLYVGRDAFKENPIIGSGPGTFRDIYAGSRYSLQYPKEETDERRYPAHNSYIEVLVGSGMVGLVFFFFVVLVSLKNFHSAKKYFRFHGNKETSSLIGAYQLSLIALLVGFLFLSSVYIKYFWISLALSQVALRLSRGIPEEKSHAITHLS